MALQLKHKTLTLTLIPIRPFSSSSSSSFPPPPPPPDSSNDDQPNPPSFSSPLSDIKQSLKSSSPPPAPPRRIPTIPNPNPNPNSSSLADIRNALNEFRLKPPNPNPNPNPNSNVSFQGLFNNPDPNPNPNPNRDRGDRGRLSFDSIRESLNQFRNAPRETPNEKARSFQSAFNIKAFQESLRSPTVPARDRGGQLPDSIFGRELREKKEETGEGGEKKAVSTEFVRMYSYEELGEKLRKLRPAEAAGEGKEWLSLKELNGRLAKLREMEEKETQDLTGGVSFRDLRESLVRLKEADTNRKLNSSFFFFLLL